MRLSLNAYNTVKEVKDAFSKAFPYLKVEFYSEPHQRGEASSPHKRVLPDTILIDVTGIMKEGEINIEPNQTIAEVEDLFQNQYSLPIQIFRNSNGTWIETTKTDNLTLAAQNEMGQQAAQITAHVKVGYYED